MWHRFVTDKALIDKFDVRFPLLPPFFICCCQQPLISRALVSPSQLWSLESFVEGNRNYRFCARPGCDRLVEYKKDGAREIRCSCGKEFCFKCRVCFSPLAPSNAFQALIAWS